MNNAIEVDGVIFETIISQTLLTIPEPKRGAYTPVQLGIRINNNTQTSFHFSSNFYSFFPELIAPDGQLMQTGFSCDRQNKPLESDYVLIVPGESVTFSREAFLFWIQNPKKKRDRKLTLNIRSPHQEVYIFSPLYSGTY